MEEYQIGLQMYAVKHVAEDDLITTLKKIKKIGYNAIELVGYYSFSPGAIRQITKKIGLAIPSVHVPLRIYDEQKIEKDFERSAQFVAEVGSRNIVIPWLPIREKIKQHEVVFLQQLLKTLAKIAANHKIQLVLHNFSREFMTVDSDRFIIDQIIENLDEHQIRLELDIGKIYMNGHDPVDVYNRYESRTQFLHLRSVKEGRSDCLLEHGVIDYKRILPQLNNLKDKVMYIEQQVHLQRALEDAQMNFQYVTQILQASGGQARADVGQYQSGTHRMNNGQKYQNQY